MQSLQTLCRKVKVVAYSGYKANERPIYFVLDGQKKEINKIIERWYGQDHDYYKVIADDGAVYLIKWHRSLDCWTLEKK